MAKTIATMTSVTTSRRTKARCDCSHKCSRFTYSGQLTTSSVIIMQCFCVQQILLKTAPNNHHYVDTLPLPARLAVTSVSSFATR